jgi:hypothetical protein
VSLRGAYSSRVATTQIQPQDALRSAIDLAHIQNDPIGAETYFRLAMQSRDVAVATRACLEAISMFRGVGDYAAMRTYAIEGGWRVADPADAARLKDAERTADARLHTSEFSSLIQGQRPTLRPLSEREERLTGGVTVKTLMDGMGQMHSSRDPHIRGVFDDLNRQQDVNVDLTGTLIRDRQGRFGVRDETTGRVTAVDFAWGRNWVLTEATKDIGNTVSVTGTSPLWSEGRSMKVTGYHSAADGHRLNPRVGFRIVDQRATIAASQAKQRGIA